MAQYYFVLSAILLSIGVYLVLTRRNAVAILFGVELMLNASNLNLAGFAASAPNPLEGQTFALFVMVVAAAEAAVALAIVLLAYDRYRTVILDQLNRLRH